MHGRLDLPEVRRLNARFPDQPLVSISDHQREALPDATWLATVYNGIDIGNYHFRPDPGDYLVFLGRISPEKRPDRAIEIARDTGMRLVIAAKVDPMDQDYYEHAIEPLIDEHVQIEFIGEVDERGKDELLGGAYAYLFPIDWPEPFGLTMVEAMATGTPVIAYRAGSVPEVVVDGVTGYVCETYARHGRGGREGGRTGSSGVSGACGGALLAAGDGGGLRTGVPESGGKGRGADLPPIALGCVARWRGGQAGTISSPCLYPLWCIH